MRREAGTAYARTVKHSPIGRAFDIAEARAALYWIQQVQKIGYRARISAESRDYDEVVEVSLPCRDIPVFRVHRGASSVIVTSPLGRARYDTLSAALLAIAPLAEWQETTMAHCAARASRPGRASRLLRWWRRHVGFASPG